MSVESEHTDHGMTAQDSETGLSGRGKGWNVI